MSVDAIFFDTSHTWRPEDLLAINDDRHRYEIAAGVLEMTPPPVSGHSFVVANLVAAVSPQLPSDYRCGGEFGMEVGHSYRVPDFGVFQAGDTSESRVGIRADTVVLVAEVLSPSTAANDRFVKPLEYARAGIGVYLLLDRATRQITVQLLEPGADSYRIGGVFGPGDTIELDRPIPLAIPVEAVFPT